MNNKSDGGMMLNFQSDKILFYVKSDETINLKARVLEDYNYDNDSWSIEGDIFTNPLITIQKS